MTLSQPADHGIPQDQIAEPVHHVTANDFDRELRQHYLEIIRLNSAQTPGQVNSKTRPYVSSSGIPYQVWEAGLRQALQKPQATFKFPSMVAALDEIACKSQDVLCIFPTGSGKSMLMVLPPLFEPTQTTIIFSNFNILTSQLPGLFISKGINAVAWSQDLLADESCPRVVIAPIETLSRDSMRRFIQSLSRIGRLARFVIDEAHTAITALTYRPVFRSLATLRSATQTDTVPLILLTATCPPAWTPALLQYTGCRSGTRVYRELSDRPNLQFSIKTPPVTGNSINKWQSAVVNLIGQLGRETLLSPQDKAIVFCRTRRQAETLESMMSMKDIPTRLHVSTMDINLRRQHVESWSRGSVKILFCTSGFGQGVDDANVRLVILVESPYNVLDLAQQAGRAGRDGKPAKVVLVPSTTKVVRRDREPRLNGQYHLQDWLGISGDLEADSADLFDTSRGCLRRQLASHLDEGLEHIDCLARSGPVERCDHCATMSRLGNTALEAQSSWNGLYFSFDHTPGTVSVDTLAAPVIPCGVLGPSQLDLQAATTKFGSRKFRRTGLPEHLNSHVSQDQLYNGWIRSLKESLEDVPPCGFCYMSLQTRPTTYHKEGEACCQLSLLPETCCLFCLQDGSHRKFDNGTCEMAPWISDGPAGLKTFENAARCNKCGEWRQDSQACVLDDFVPQIIFCLYARLDWRMQISSTYKLSDDHTLDLPSFRDWLFQPQDLTFQALPNLVKVFLEFVVPAAWLIENFDYPLL